MIGVITDFYKLSAEQRAFVKSQKITQAMSAHKWVRFFEPICRFDEKCDFIRERVEGIAVASFFIIFISFFIAAFTESLWPILLGFLPGPPSWFSYVYMKNRDVNNNIRNTLFPLLNVMSLELGNTQKISLDINFNKNLKRKDRLDFPGTPPNTVFYAYDVLSLKCTLKDGTKLSWLVKDLIRKTRKTNYRGKVKTKRKLKRRILVSMNFNTALYQMHPKAVQAMPKIKADSAKRTLKPLENTLSHMKHSSDKISFKRMLKQSAPGTLAPIDFKELLECTRSPYQVLVKNQ